MSFSKHRISFTKKINKKLLVFQKLDSFFEA